MPLTNHELIFLGLTAFAAFLGARLASRGKSDTAGIVRLEQKIDSILAHLGLTGYSVPTANTPVPGISSAYSVSAPSVSATGDILDLIQRGKKIEAIKLYRQQNPGSDLLTAKNAVEQMERGGP